MEALIKKYPSAYAVYDLGKYYGIATMDESFYIADKRTLKPVEVRLRYESEVLELINRAIPVWFAQDE